VAEFIRDLHAAGVEVMWLTTWGTSANGDVCDLLGLPQFPVAGTVLDGHDPEWWWKLQVAARLYARDPKPFVWIDDDLRRCPDAVDWAYGLPEGDCLLVSPDTADGLIPTQLEEIRAFVAAHGVALKATADAWERLLWRNRG